MHFCLLSIRVVTSQELRVEESIQWALIQKNCELSTLFFNNQFFYKLLQPLYARPRIKLPDKNWLTLPCLRNIAVERLEWIVKRVVKGVQFRSWFLSERELRVDKSEKNPLVTTLLSIMLPCWSLPRWTLAGAGSYLTRQPLADSRCCPSASQAAMLLDLLVGSAVGRQPVGISKQTKISSKKW